MPRALTPLLACLFVIAGCSETRTAAAQSNVRPLVYLESDPDGTRYVRVMERSTTAFTPARSIVNLSSSPRINITDALPTLVRNVSVRNGEYGVNITGPAPVSIDHFTFYDWNGGGDIYGAAIKIDRSSAAATYIQRVLADGREAPDASYDRSNTDFIGIERGSAPVFVRYATGRNWGDAGIDAKSNVALMNVTIDSAHRGLRAWSNVTITIANGIVNVPSGHEQIWVQGANARVRFYNTLWCIGVETPSPNADGCSYTPTAIGADGVTAAQARRQVTALTTNTLVSNSFFATEIDRVVVQYSRNAGGSWTAMAAGGANGRAPLGDMRYRVPFTLSSGTYLFRAYFEREGHRVGAITTINEAGQTV